MKALMKALLKIRQLEQRLYGTYKGIVTDVSDPEGLDRVKVRIFSVLGQDIEKWARVRSPFGGNAYGWSFLPIVGDEIAIEFRNGDVNCPEWVGFYYSGEHLPSEKVSPSVRILKTVSGHKVVFDDTEGAEILTIEHRNGSKFVIDNDGIQISDVNNSTAIISTGISLGSVNAEEPIVKGDTLMGLLEELIDAVLQMSNQTSVGPTVFPPINVTTFQSIRQRLDTMKSTQNRTD